MTSLTLLAQTLDHLSGTLTHHPQLALLLTLHQLDPFYQLYNVEEDEYWDDPLPIAIQIVRGNFPSVYCEFIHVWQQGLPRDELSDWLCQALNTQLYAPLECLEQVIFGPPFQGYGLDWADLDPLPAPQREIVPILLEALGITEESTSDVIQHACQVVGVLVISLEKHPRLENIGYALEWITSSTGNTLADCTDDVIAEMGYAPFEWSSKDLVFLAELHEEAEMVVANASAGLTQLAETPELLEQLLTNIQTLLPSLPRRQYRVERHHLTPYTRHCHWHDHPAPTPEHATSTGAEIL